MSSHTPVASSVLPPALATILPYYALAMAVLVFYGNVYDNVFLYDDTYLIVNNQYIRSWHSLGDIFTSYVNTGADRKSHFYRPLQNIVYLMLYQIGGLRSLPYHLLNISLHAANAGLVYRLGLKLGFKQKACFLAALIWALHPIQTEAVTYMSATADTLYSLFCLTGLIVLLPDATPRQILLACFCMTLGLLSKETAIVFPLLAMSCRYLTATRPWRLNTYANLWPLALIAVGYLVLRYLFLPFSARDLVNIDPVSQIYAGHILVRLYTFLATLPLYLKLLLGPVGLHMDRGVTTYLDPWHGQVAAGAFLVIGAAAYILRASRPAARPLAWGFLWFAGAHITQTGIFVPVNALLLEHWMYLPSAGLGLGLAQSIARAAERYAVPSVCSSAIGLMLAFALGLATSNQNEVWRDPFRFYGAILADGESSYRAHNNLGIAYLDIADYPHAMEQFHYNAQHQDYSPEAHQNIAAVLARQYPDRSHSAEEIMELKRALAINPDFIPAYVGLAQLYDDQGDRQAADAARQKAEFLRQALRP